MPGALDKAVDSLASDMEDTESDEMDITAEDEDPLVVAFEEFNAAAGDPKLQAEIFRDLIELAK